MPLDAALEARLKALPPPEAAAALVRGYGGEIYGFLAATMHDPNDADDAFAMFSEGVWRGLAEFRGESAYRNWAYQVARNSARKLMRGDGRRRRRFDGGGTSAAEKVAWEVRSTTAVFKRTDIKDRMRALRAELRVEDQELLVLRVDRGLEWNDVAIVLEEDAATLRKRFERVKEKLKAMAAQAGLMPSG